MWDQPGEPKNGQKTHETDFGATKCRRIKIWVQPAEHKIWKKIWVQPAELKFWKKMGVNRLNSKTSWDVRDVDKAFVGPLNRFGTSPVRAQSWNKECSYELVNPTFKISLLHQEHIQVVPSIDWFWLPIFHTNLVRGFSNKEMSSLRRWAICTRTPQ